MKSQVTLADAVGKTVQAFCFSGGTASQFMIVFSDDTFTVLGADYDQEYNRLFFEQKNLDVLGFGKVALLASGVVSVEEYTEVVRLSLEKEQEQIRERELNMLSSLMKKYPDDAKTIISR